MEEGGVSAKHTVLPGLLSIWIVEIPEVPEAPLGDSAQDQLTDFIIQQTTF